MRRQHVWVCVLGALVAMGLTAAPAAAATTEDVLAKLTANEGVVKTFEVDTKTTAKVGAQSHEMAGHMVVQGIMKDGKRTGSLVNFKQKMTVGQMEMATLMVCDGEFMWMETRNPQMGVMVMKNKIDAAKKQTVDTSNLRDMYDLKLVGEEEFDGQPMWILEGTPKAKADAAATAVEPARAGQPETGKVRIDIGQKDLVTHRIHTYDKAGNEVSDMQFTNIKINGTVDPALFKYTPPEGATVMDMTKGMPDFGSMMKNMPKGMPKGMPKDMPPDAPGSGAGE